MKLDACFARDHLQDFALGRLDPREHSRIETHLEHCEAWEATVAGFDDATDLLLRELRRQPEDCPFASDASFQQATQRVASHERSDPQGLPASGTVGPWSNGDGLSCRALASSPVGGVV